jgi:hypothetical protein
LRKVSACAVALKPQADTLRILASYEHMSFEAYFNAALDVVGLSLSLEKIGIDKVIAGFEIVAPC